MLDIGNFKCTNPNEVPNRLLKAQNNHPHGTLEHIIVVNQSWRKWFEKLDDILWAHKSNFREQAFDQKAYWGIPELWQPRIRSGISADSEKNPSAKFWKGKACPKMCRKPIPSQVLTWEGLY